MIYPRNCPRTGNTHVHSTHMCTFGHSQLNAHHNHLTDRKHEWSRGKIIFPRWAASKLHSHDFAFGHLTPHLCSYPLFSVMATNEQLDTLQTPVCKELSSRTMPLISEKREYYGGNAKKWALRTPVYKNLWYTSIFGVRKCNNPNSGAPWKVSLLAGTALHNITVDRVKHCAPGFVSSLPSWMGKAL